MIDDLEKRGLCLMVGSALQDIVERVQLIMEINHTDKDDEEVRVSTQCILGDIMAIADIVQDYTADQALDSAEKILQEEYRIWS